MRLLRALLFSLAIHALIVFCLKKIQVEAPAPQSIDNMVEFIDTPQPRSEDDKRIVRAQNLPADLLKERDPKDKARFVSENDQTVLQETRSAESGMTRNRSMAAAANEKAQMGARDKTAPTPAQAVPKKSKLNPKFFEIERHAPDPQDIVIDEKESTEPPTTSDGQQLKFSGLSPYGLERGRSTLGETLPSNIKLGEMTALNTDRYLYYTFYARAEELIRHHWERYVRAVLYSYERTGAATGDELWVTRIEILLNKNGDFVRGLVHQGSGLQGLDLAPVHAFKDAKQIPHPPLEMIDKDGYIRMQYEFSVRMVGHIASGS